MAASLVSGQVATGSVWALSASVTLPGPTTPGNFLLVLVSAEYGGTITVSDNKGNTYSTNANASASWSGNVMLQAFWLAPIVTGGASHQVTVTTTVANGSVPAFTVSEWTGIASSPFDAYGSTISSYGTSSSATTTASTVQADELVVSVIRSVTTCNFTPGSTLTKLDEVDTASADTHATAYKIVSASGAQTADWTSSDTIGDITAVFTFKAQVGPTKAATPTASVTTGQFSSPQYVRLSSSTDGATVYYTTDGTQPTTSSPVYSGPIAITSATTIRAYAVADGYLDSDSASWTYTIQLAPARPQGWGFGLSLRYLTRANLTETSAVAQLLASPGFQIPTSPQNLLSGSAAGAATATGTLTTGILLQGTADGVGTATGDLTTGTGPNLLSPSQADGVGTSTGSLTTGINLGGSAAGVGAARPATLTTAVQLSGTAAGIGAASASSLTTAIQLASAPTAGVGTASSAGLATGIRLAGSAAGAGTATGSLTTSILLSGSAAGIGTASGSLTTGSGFSLQGSAAGLGTATGTLTTAILLASAAAAGIGSASAASLATGIQLSTPATPGVGAASGSLTTAIQIVGSAAGIGTCFGTLSDGAGQPLSHRYWRIFMPQAQSASVIIQEVYFETSTGTLLTSPAEAASGAAFASSVSSGWEPKNAFDQGWGNWASSNGPDQGAWFIGYDFGCTTPGRTVSVEKFGLVSQNTYAPVSVKLQWSDDKATWTDATPPYGMTWTEGWETQLFTVPPPIFLRSPPTSGVGTCSGDLTTWSYSGSWITLTYPSSKIALDVPTDTIQLAVPSLPIQLDLGASTLTLAEIAQTIILQIDED